MPADKSLEKSALFVTTGMAILAVFKGGDTYPYSPETNKEEAYNFWIWALRLSAPCPALSITNNWGWSMRWSCIGVLHEEGLRIHIHTFNDDVGRLCFMASFD